MRKMIKNVLCKWNVLTIMLIVMMSIVVASCSKDDDSSQDKTITSIHGTWRYDWGSTSRSFTAYTFNSDGSGVLYDKGNPGVPFTYVYDNQNNVITITYSPYNKETLLVSKVTSNYMGLDGEEYKRVDSI